MTSCRVVRAGWTAAREALAAARIRRGRAALLSALMSAGGDSNVAAVPQRMDANRKMRPTTTSANGPSEL